MDATNETIQTTQAAGEPSDLEHDAAADAVEESPALNEANSTVKTYVIASMALGLVPVPVFDMVAVVGTQLKMIHALTRIYEVKFTENVAKSLILSLVGGVLPVTAAAGVGSLLKAIPGLGTLAGSASVSLLSGALTYAVGRVFVSHFESGGTLLDFDAAKVRERFRAEFQRGKTAAQEIKEEQEGTQAAA